MRQALWRHCLALKGAISGEVLLTCVDADWHDRRHGASHAGLPARPAAAGSGCCVGKSAGLGSPRQTGWCWRCWPDCCPASGGRSSWSLRARCCAGTANWSRDDGPTHLLLTAAVWTPRGRGSAAAGAGESTVGRSADRRGVPQAHAGGLRDHSAPDPSSAPAGSSAAARGCELGAVPARRRPGRWRWTSSPWTRCGCAGCTCCSSSRSSIAGCTSPGSPQAAGMGAEQNLHRTLVGGAAYSAYQDTELPPGPDAIRDRLALVTDAPPGLPGAAGVRLDRPELLRRRPDVGLIVGDPAAPTALAADLATYRIQRWGPGVTTTFVDARPARIKPAGVRNVRCETCFPHLGGRADCTDGRTSLRPSPRRAACRPLSAELLTSSTAANVGGTADNPGSLVHAIRRTASAWPGATTLSARHRGRGIAGTWQRTRGLGRIQRRACAESGSAMVGLEKPLHQADGVDHAILVEARGLGPLSGNLW
jgi:hypothetical protein